MNQIKFKPGKPFTFIATRSFALGKFDVTIAKDDEILFDGSKVEHAGMEYSFPNLRGAIKTGWIVLAEDYDVNDPTYGKPVSANIQVRHPTEGGNPMAPDKKMSISTTESDERVVGNATQHAAATKAGNTRRSMPVTSSGGVEDQDGIPVRSLKTAAVSKTNITHAGQAMRDLQNVQIDGGESVNTEEAHLAAMNEEERETYKAQKASRRAAYVDTQPERRVVGKVVSTGKQATSEGIVATSKVGGGIETADPVDPGKKTEETVHYEDGIKMTNTNGPKNGAPQPARAAAAAPLDQGNLDTRLRIAKALCPTFPDSYDFNASSRKKLAFLEDFEDEDGILLAVFAAETDAFKLTLQQEFPAAFAS